MNGVSLSICLFYFAVCVCVCVCVCVHVCVFGSRASGIIKKKLRSITSAMAYTQLHCLFLFHYELAGLKTNKNESFREDGGM